MKSKGYQLKLNTMDDKEKIKYYVAFSFLNVKPIIKAKIFEFFDYDVKRAFNVDENDLQALCEFYEISIPREFIKKRNEIDIEACFKKAFSDEEIKILTYEDEKYPQLLKQIPDFPLSLYYKGNLQNIDYNFNLAVVGSRNASENAKNALHSLISNFNNTNITIVSGLAYGIDTQAHKSAIANSLKTIAVVGCGLDIVYPAQNKNLFNEIVNEYGAVISEYPLGTPPLTYNFPQRNRIVVGMSKGVLVGEAQLKSGAMISANLALDYNRELMCIPGNVLSPNTQGIYHLIRNGAGIIANASDLLNQMGWDIIQEETKKSEVSDLQKVILETIAIEEKTFDEIAQITQMNVADLMVSLTELELKSLIKQTNNKYYIM